MIDVTIRPMLDSEVTLVRDSWTRSLDGAGHGSGPSAGRYIVRVGDAKMIGWAWFEMHRAWVRSLLEQPDAHVLVATLPGHDEAIGWCAVSSPGNHPLVVHYVYTLAIARGKGVATGLVAAALGLGDARPARFSHSSAAGTRVVERARAVAA